MTYNLIDEKWIPAETVTGARTEASLGDLIVSPDSIRAVHGDTMPQTLAISRLLSAIVYRAFSNGFDTAHPADWWHACYSDPSLISKVVGTYLDRWHDRFDLLDEKNPFFQAAGIEYDREGFSPLSSLAIDEPKAERALFSMGEARYECGVPLGEAARHLVTIQAFDTAGIKGSLIGSGGRAGKAYAPKSMPACGWCGAQTSFLLRGSDLAQTLLLNCPPIDADGVPLLAREGDIPPWELSSPTAESRTARAAGPIQAYTWQSRRIRLVPNGDRVVGVIISYGDTAPRNGRVEVDPMAMGATASSKDSTIVPFSTTEGPLWTNIADLIQGRTAEDGAAMRRPSASIAWAAQTMPRDLRIAIDEIGLAYDKYKAVIEYEVSSSQVVDTSVFDRNPDLPLLRSLSACASAYARFATDVESACGDLRPEAGLRSAPYARTLADAKAEATWAVGSIADSILTRASEDGSKMRKRAVRARSTFLNLADTYLIAHCGNPFSDPARKSTIGGALRSYRSYVFKVFSAHVEESD